MATPFGPSPSAPTLLSLSFRSEACCLFLLPLAVSILLLANTSRYCCAGEFVWGGGGVKIVLGIAKLVSNRSTDNLYTYKRNTGILSLMHAQTVYYYTRLFFLSPSKQPGDKVLYNIIFSLLLWCKIHYRTENKTDDYWSNHWGLWSRLHQIFCPPGWEWWILCPRGCSWEWDKERTVNKIN